MGDIFSILLSEGIRVKEVNSNCEDCNYDKPFLILGLAIPKKEEGNRSKQAENLKKEAERIKQKTLDLINQVEEFPMGWELARKDIVIFCDSEIENVNENIQNFVEENIIEK